MKKQFDYIIDVRSEAEYAAGHVDQAILIPHTEIEAKIAAAVPSKDSSVALYCRSGRRSGIALEAMQKMGYTKAENLGSLEDASQALNIPIVQ